MSTVIALLAVLVPAVAKAQYGQAAPSTLTPQQQAEVDWLLRQWEQHGAGVKTFECKFTRFDWDPVWRPDRPLHVVEGEIKYAAPDKGMLRVDGELVEVGDDGHPLNGVEAGGVLAFGVDGGHTAARLIQRQARVRLDEIHLAVGEILDVASGRTAPFAALGQVGPVEDRNNGHGDLPGRQFRLEELLERLDAVIDAALAQGGHAQSGRSRMVSVRSAMALFFLSVRHYALPRSM